MQKSASEARPHTRAVERATGLIPVEAADDERLTVVELEATGVEAEILALDASVTFVQPERASTRSAAPAVVRHRTRRRLEA